MNAAFFKSIADAKWFQQFVIATIVLAGIVVGIETYQANVPNWMPLLHIVDYLILLVFTLEAAIKIMAEGSRPGNYFKDPWNVFDFIIVLACWLPVFLPDMDTTFVSVFRLARILRVLRLVSALPQLRMLVDALLKSIPSMGYVGILLFLLFYIYGAMGVFLFGGNDPVHFGNLHTSLLTLFQIVTLEGWADIMYVNIFGCDHPQWGAENCPNPEPHMIAGALYFISFVLIGTMIVLNLFIGVIMNSMEEVRNEQAAEERSKRKEDGIDLLEDDISEIHVQLNGIKEKLDAVAQRVRVK
jgi:voltage-gated sodium channel